jgi:hypothetical protein
MGNVPGLPRIIQGPNLKQRIVALREQAQQIGRLKEFDQALADLEQALLTRPLPPDDAPNLFGDRQYSIPPFTISLGIIRPLVVYFGATAQTIVHHGAVVYPVLIYELRLLT